jgi:hypothetical protein
LSVIAVRFWGSQNGQRRIELLPLPDPPPCPVSGVTDCARHLGGCLLAHAPDSFVVRKQKSGCLYEPAIFAFSGSLVAPVLSCPFLASVNNDCHGITWEAMEIFGPEGAYFVLGSVPEQHIEVTVSHF